jgi:aldose 1-epimerase
LTDQLSSLRATGTFTLPSSGKSYTLAANDNNGADTLHGGFVGYDGRVWSLVEQSSNHLKFSLNDPDGSQGFPGTVTAYVTYTLENNAKWTTSMRAYSDLETPIMLSSHAYWNLEAYQDSKDLSNHYIQLAADRYVATDSILIPNGELPSVEGTALDLRQPTQVSAAIQKTVGTDLCGPGGTG